MSPSRSQASLSSPWCFFHCASPLGQCSDSAQLLIFSRKHFPAVLMKKNRLGLIVNQNVLLTPTLLLKPWSHPSASGSLSSGWSSLQLWTRNHRSPQSCWEEVWTKNQRWYNTQDGDVLETLDLRGFVFLLSFLGNLLSHRTPVTKPRPQPAQVHRTI